MKCHSGGAAASIAGEQRALVAQLLGVVLAERALAGGDRGAHVVGGHLLADRQQAHRAGRAAGGPRGGGDPLAHPGQVGRRSASARVTVREPRAEARRAGSAAGRRSACRSASTSASGRPMTFVCEPRSSVTNARRASPARRSRRPCRATRRDAT